MNEHQNQKQLFDIWWLTGEGTKFFQSVQNSRSGTTTDLATASYVLAWGAWCAGLKQRESNNRRESPAAAQDAKDGTEQVCPWCAFKWIPLPLVTEAKDGCPKCGAGSMRPIDLGIRAIIDGEDKIIRCGICDGSFTHASAFHEHAEKCGTSTQTRAALQSYIDKAREAAGIPAGASLVAFIQDLKGENKELRRKYNAIQSKIEIFSAQSSEGTAKANCSHPPESVVTDRPGELAIRWCRICGAYRCVGPASVGEWRSPEGAK